MKSKAKAPAMSKAMAPPMPPGGAPPMTYEMAASSMSAQPKAMSRAAPPQSATPRMRATRGASPVTKPIVAGSLESVIS